jgi:DNA anti-recombination protein RmuC
MYIPSESVYYETLVADTDSKLASLAFAERVIPVSPSTLYAYLMVVLRGLQARQVEQNARRILELLGRLDLDFRAFVAEFDTLGNHLGNAQRKHAEAARRLSRLEAGLQDAGRLQEAEAGPIAGAVAGPSAGPVAEELPAPTAAGLSTPRRLSASPANLELLPPDGGELTLPA